EHDPPLRLEPVGPEDGVGDPRLVLDGEEEDALGRARALADQDHAGDLDRFAVLDGLQVAAADDPAPVELGAEEGEWVGAERELDRAIILDHLAALAHRGERDFGLALARIGRGEEGKGGLAEALHPRSEEHTSELQSQSNLVCRLLLEKKKKKKKKSKKKKK